MRIYNCGAQTHYESSHLDDEDCPICGPGITRILPAEKIESPEMNFDTWLQYGVDNGYCTDQVCMNHAGVPMSDKEMDDDNGDFFIHVVRLGTPEDWDAEFSEGEE
jgi:hypothetical protein